MMSNSSPRGERRDDDLEASAAQPAIGPPPQTRQPVEAGFATAITHYAVSPAVAADGGKITQDRRGSPDLTQLPEPITKGDDDKQQHTDQRGHENHGRAHRRALVDLA